LSTFGCGPGNSTALLVARFPDAKIVGIDSSPAMIAEARKTLPHAQFQEADASTWLPASDTDLLFANAVHHWIPDHLSLFPRLLTCLRPGAVAAIQKPDNLAEPTHRLMQQVADDGPWRERLSRVARASLPPASVYFNALSPVTTRLDIWHTIYNHVLDGPDAIVDWVSGTGLRPFLDPLSPEERQDFMTRYRGRIGEAYPANAAGEVLLRFPRLFIVAVR
jgi:trans-aconitate 2-methyltransferase